MVATLPPNGEGGQCSGNAGVRWRQIYNVKIFGGLTTEFHRSDRRNVLKTDRHTLTPAMSSSSFLISGVAAKSRTSC